MGTSSTKKFLKHDGAGGLQNEAALTTSDGVADADKIPALNASGVLDGTILNATATSSGVASAGKTVVLDGTGRLDSTVLPVGIGADTKSIQASENLTAGDFVNIHDVSGSARVRKADATTNGKPAHGFVLSTVTSGSNATIYFEGANTQLTGLTAGLKYFLHTTAGGVTTTPPSAANTVVQCLGVATSTTEINAEIGTLIIQN